MKAQNPGGLGTNRRGRSTMRIPQIPIEWMDPMSWRLPSGMALAEFALQTGFLAPLIMRAPKPRKKASTTEMAAKQTMDAGGLHPGASQQPVEEAPGRKASFWESR